MQSNMILFFRDIYNQTYLKVARFRKKIKLEYNSDFEFLFCIAGEDFGILQKKYEIESLCKFVSSTKPKAVCEIGCYRGGTSFLLASSLSSAQKFIFIDKKIYNEKLLRYYVTKHQELHFFEGDSTSNEVIGRLDSVVGEDLLDFLFIDGDHNFEGVKRDFLTYYDRVREGGYIAFHDIVPDHRTLYDLQSGSWSGDVHRVWAIVKTVFQSCEFVEKEGQDGFGIGVVKKDGGVSRSDVEKVFREHCDGCEES